MEQVNQLSKLHDNVEIKEKMIKQLLQDEVKVNHEVEMANRDVDQITDLMKSFTVPDVIEYINQKAQLHDMKKNVKVSDP